MFPFMKHRILLWLALPVMVLVAALFWTGRNNKDLESVEAPELVPEQMSLRANMSALAATPDWSKLQDYQYTMPRDIFMTQLNAVYSQDRAWHSVITVHEDFADVRGSGNERIRVYFAGRSQQKPPPRYWRSARELPSAPDLSGKPLSGLRIAVDPGHIGGEWSRMEERWYRGNGGHEVKEGELTLATAILLKEQLESLGAKVWLLRDKPEPVTKLRPSDFRPLAIQVLKSRGKEPTENALRRASESLFYRAHEIRRRAQIINTEIKPDIALCLHLNAESWGNPEKPTMVSRNHFHLLINGTYSARELRLEDNRFHLLKRLFQRTHDEELALNRSIAKAMAEETGLPPYIYTTNNAKLIDTENPYIYARNLLANRVYHCPVVFLEPYVMNNPEVYKRISMGDYDGKSKIAGTMRKSLIREYADGVTEGLRLYYQTARGNNP